MAIPKLALIPAAQGTSLYSVLPSNGVGDFAFTRGTTATRINSQGLIETVASGVSRLNYPLIDGVVNGCPSHLLEPTRSNDLQKSQEFNDSYWTKYQSSVLDNLSISPDGSLNADKLIEDNSSATHQLGRAINYVSGTTYTVSIFAKSSNRNLEISAGNTNTFPAKAIFDLSNGIVLSTTFGNASIKYFGNGWYRCVISSTAASTSTTNINFGIVNGYALSYNGDGSSFLELFGVSREIGSYATSYIPTQGSAVTRVADVSSQTPPSGIIGQTEGAMLIDFIPKSKDDLQILFQVRTIGSSNVGQVDIRLQSGNIRCIGNDGGSPQFNITGTSFNVGERYKCAIRYKENDVAFYINGVLIGTDTTASFSSSSKNQISFSENLSSFLPIVNVKDARLYNTALTDAELQALTTL
mgnify:CR=1 FL=1